MDEALALIGAAVDLHAGWAQLLSSYALVLNVAKRSGEALEMAERALAIDAACADAVFQRGTALLGLNRAAEALPCFDDLLAQAPDHIDAMVNRANALLRLERPEEAIAALGSALAAKPEHTGILNNYGQALTAAGRNGDAIRYFDAALAINPDYAQARINRAEALLNLDRPAEALQEAETALALSPGHPVAINMRGVALIDLGRPEEAIAVFETLIALAPTWAQPYNNLGRAQVALNRFAEALPNFRIASELAPHFVLASSNLAMANLIVGNFARGWKIYEGRRQAPRQCEAPQWRGHEPLAGQRLLLYAEQGFGDTMQFVRYAYRAAMCGATVIVEVQQDLAGLLGSVAGVAQVVPRGEPLPAHDLCCPMPSLPLAFRTSAATIPAGVPYLAPPPDRVAQWAPRLPATGKPRVGLVWAGNPQHKNDRNRSMPMRRAMPLLAAAQVDWVVLQAGLDAFDRAALDAHGNITSLGHELRDFGDSAAILADLDLVITVDTALAHLAGAMGKPVWILLPFSPDWRWQLDRSDSPWYPTARLFRQPAIGAWDPVVETVSAESRNSGFPRRYDQRRFNNSG